MSIIITKIKDKLLRHTILVRSRNMFYIGKNSEIIEPEFCYKNMTHREWFSNIGLDVSDKFLLRGYYRNGRIYCPHCGTFSVKIERNSYEAYHWIDGFSDARLLEETFSKMKRLNKTKTS